MASHAFVSSRQWSDEELERDRKESIRLFVASLLSAGPDIYEGYLKELRPLVEGLVEKTDGLAMLGDKMPSLVDGEREALRFACAPPLSSDNLATVSEIYTEDKGLSKDDALFECVMSMLNRQIFPWLAANRLPDDGEKMRAIEHMSSLWAIQKAQTRMRTIASHDQEDAVKALLEDSGFARAGRRKEILLIDDLRPGTFCGESIVAGQKCDVPVRLLDGRLMLIECKVTNSYTNSVKRIIRETCGKASTWRDAFGSQVVLAAVIDGVVKLKNLKEAQNEHGLSLYWGFRLDDLSEFVQSATARK